MLGWIHQVNATIFLFGLFYMFIAIKVLPTLSAVFKGRYKLTLLRAQLTTLLQRLTTWIIVDATQTLSIFCTTMILDVTDICEESMSFHAQEQQTLLWSLETQLQEIALQTALMDSVNLTQDNKKIKKGQTGI